VGREPWQLRFDGGHQQRYFETRRALAECVLRVARQSPDRRFEVWAEAESTPLLDGSVGGRTYELLEVLDLDDPQTAASLRSELVDRGSRP
jgi:hypothetical protein